DLKWLVCNSTLVVGMVSSVLNRDVKQYGKKYMFDGNEETCWNSDQGELQWVILEFPQSVKVSELKVQFQGGFSAKTCTLEGKTLRLSFPPSHFNEAHAVDKVKIMFENSADFFGRLIVYSLDVLGEKAS
uniref:Nuclear receptor 2C2-associated protein n=1 Tax=Mola mola TaxID=94237 RepID=A0A3Q3VJU9_MOLML